VTNIGDNDFDEFSGDLFASNCRLSGIGLGPAKKPPRISPFLFHNNNLLKKVDLGGLQEMGSLEFSSACRGFSELELSLSVN
jgi:hypothetical protein